MGELLTIEVQDCATIDWRPTVKQEQFLSLPDDLDEALYGGAAGGGKSEMLLMLPIVKGWYKHPRFKGIIFRRQFPDLNRSLIQRSHEMGIYKALGGKYNGQDHVWTFETPAGPGGTIRFGHLQTEKDVYSHKSAEYNYIGFDELTSFTEFQYKYMGSRLRTSIDGLPKVRRSASNPGDIGHSWVRKRFVEPYKHGGKVLYEPRTNTYRIFIPAKLTDNPHLMKADPNYINRLMALPEAERKALMDGDWWAFAGQVFNEWRENRYPDEPEHAMHVIEPFQVPYWWPKIIAMDWGFTAMTWVGWFAVAPDRRVFLYREYSCKKKYIEHWGADVLRASQFDGNIVKKTLDPSAWAQRGSPETIAAQLSRVTGWTDIEQADNDRLGGKMLVHEFLRWKERPAKYVPLEGYSEETEQFIYRMRGSEAVNEYRAMFKEDPPETNLPKLQVFNTCKKFIEVVPLCVYDEKNPEDVAEFDGDDPYDGGRYGLKAVDEFTKISDREYERQCKFGAIIHDYQKDGDLNRLAQRVAEHQDAEEIRPVALYHSAGGGAPRRSGSRYN